MRTYKEIEIKILKLINDFPSITIDEMCECLYLGRTTVMQYLRKFKEEKLLYDNGEKKTKLSQIIDERGSTFIDKNVNSFYN